MKNSASNGITLIENLIATLVFTIALVAVVSSIASIVDVIDDAKDTTVATADLRNVMEKIKATPFDSVTTKFPKGVSDGPASNLYSAIVDNYTLTNEHITVTYKDENAEPLEINAAMSWQNKKGRSFSRSMSTFKMR